MCHPDCELDSDDSEAADIGLLFSQNKIENTLQQIVGTDSILTTDYRKAISEFENEEYADCVRDIGRASELLIEIMLLESFNEEDLPDNMAGRINMLDKTSDGAPSFNGKTISPIWWLRNNVAHANSYNISEEEALYALSCYQIAVKKLVDYLDS